MAKNREFVDIIETRLKNNRQHVYLSEFLEYLANLQGDQSRVQAIKDYAARGDMYAKVIRQFMETMWHPAVQFQLPETDPPYKKGEYPDLNLAPTSLFKAFSTVKYFAKCEAMIPQTIKREAKFIQTLESMHEKEAEVFLMCKNKRLKGFPRVTEKVFREAMPGILPEKTKKEEVGNSQNTSGEDSGV